MYSYSSCDTRTVMIGPELYYSEKLWDSTGNSSVILRLYANSHLTKKDTILSRSSSCDTVNMEDSQPPHQGHTETLGVRSLASGLVAVSRKYSGDMLARDWEGLRGRQPALPEYTGYSQVIVFERLELGVGNIYTSGKKVHDYF